MTEQESAGHPVVPPPIIGPPMRPLRGAPMIWLFVAAFFLLLISFQFFAIANPRGASKDQSLLQRTVESAELRYEIARATGDAKQKDEVLRETIADLNSLPLRTRGGGGIRARMKLILSQELSEPPPPVLSELNAYTDDIVETPEDTSSAKEESRKQRTRLNAYLEELYTGQPDAATKKRLAAAIESITGGRFPYSIAIERARGDDKAAASKMQGANVAVLLAAFLGCCLWAAYAIARLMGKLRPLGSPLSGAGPAVADNLGAAVLVVIAVGQLAIPILLAGFFGPSSSPWAQVAYFTVTALFALYFIPIPRLGVRVSLSRLGLRFDRWKQDVAWGVAMWVANVPILLFALFLGAIVSRWIPSAEHPAARQFEDPSTVLPALLGAVLLAPLVEEIIFRGALFQGLLLRLRSVTLAVILNGVLFAAIHPQGGVALLALAWIGASACLLVHQTRGLLAPIVMHALNNGVIALLTVMNV